MAVTVAQERDVPQGFVAFKVMVYVPGDVNRRVVSVLVEVFPGPGNVAPPFGVTVHVYAFPVPVERFFKSKENGTQLLTGVKSAGVLQFCGLVCGSLAGM